jgi:hypothetical protein
LNDERALLTLYDEAVSGGTIGSTESDRLRFFAAAEHAGGKGTRNPPGLFVAVVKRRLWSYISHAEEESARRRLRNYPWSACRAQRKQPPKTHRQAPTSGCFQPRDEADPQQVRELVRRSLASVQEAA